MRGKILINFCRVFRVIRASRAIRAIRVYRGGFQYHYWGVCDIRLCSIGFTSVDATAQNHLYSDFVIINERLKF